MACSENAVPHHGSWDAVVDGERIVADRGNGNRQY